MADPKITKNTMMVRPVTMEVRSETHPGESYLVTLATCPCADNFWRHHRDADPFCKHIRAAYKLAGWSLPETIDKAPATD